MLAWVVMNRQHLPRAARGPASPFFLPPRFPFWVSPLPPLRKNHPFPFIHLRGTHFATLLFSNSYMEWRGCTPLGVSSAYPLPLIPCLSRGKPRDPLSFHILAHSSALFCTRANLNSFLFKRFRTLWQKHRGGRAFVLPENCSKLCGRPSIRREKRNGTGTKACPTNLRWSCFRP